MYGFLLEVTTTTLSGVYQAVKVEYFGECFVVVGFTLFLSEFCKIRISKWLYFVEHIVSFVIMYLIFTTQQNHIFYRDMRIVNSAPHSRLVLEYGPGFYFFFCYLGILTIGTILVFIKSMKKTTALGKARIRLIIYALACPWIPLIIRASGITGGYEVSFLGVAASSILIMTALVKYGYLDSVQLAGTNALFNADEGLMVIDTNNQILYCNKRLNEWFPAAEKYSDATDYININDVQHGNFLRVELGGCICDIISEPIIEMNEIQGYLIRIIDMTEHYQQLELAEKSAHIDALTGLWDRELFKLTMMDYLKNNGNGTMFMMDIDNFKGINDNHGHDTGDKVLITLGKTLTQICNETHLCCRIGGDEFGLFLKDITTSDEIREYSETISNLYKKLISETDSYVNSSISIGGTIINNESHNITIDSFEEIYCKADEAMYAAKKGGKDRYFVNKLSKIKIRNCYYVKCIAATDFYFSIISDVISSLFL
ncbi:MAG: diguanylate cyclase [Eubacteriales bacterium]|nr:diguanylate cyclase [Eubacteriales bacterium]